MMELKLLGDRLHKICKIASEKKVRVKFDAE